MSRRTRYDRWLAEYQAERDREDPRATWARKLRAGEVEPFPPELAVRPAGETPLPLFGKAGRP